MIIPLGHEQTSVRRQPWVTWTLMALCLAAFLITLPGQTARVREGGERLQEALNYFVEHPYLEPPPRLRKLFITRIGEEQTDAQIDLMRQIGSKPPESESEVQEQQAKLEALVEKSFNAIEDTPLKRWGLVPTHFRPSSLLTYQFMHAGWMHLLGNLFLLFLVGPFVEDVWGRPLYATFYLAAGAFAGLMFMVRYPALEAPLIGASGAIAGVMGAFLIRYWHTKIRFLYWFFVFVGTFEAPAWLMLPLWFFKELFFAGTMDSMARDAGGGGVAFWAHVWGFAFGVIVASTIAYFHVEERYIHSSIETKITLVDNTAVESAARLAEAGDTAAAIGALRRELATHPENMDAATALWNLCFRTQQMNVALPYMLEAIRRAARRGDNDFALSSWEEVLRGTGGRVPVEPALGVRLAELLAAADRDPTACDTLSLAWQHRQDNITAPILLRMARLATTLQSPHAAAIIDAALAHPEASPETRAELEAARAAVAEAPPEERAPSEPVPIEVAADRPKALRTVTAIPRTLDGAGLTIEVDGRLRNVGLGGIQAMAVGGVA